MGAGGGMRIRTLDTVEEARALEPLVAEYLRVVSVAAKRLAPPRDQRSHHQRGCRQRENPGHQIEACHAALPPAPGT